MTALETRQACALVIGYVWPEPNSSAAGSRMLQLIASLQRANFRVVFASAAAKSIHRFDLASINVEEMEIELNASSFDDFVVELAPAVVMFDRFFTEEQFGWRVSRALPNCIRLLDTEDLHSLRHARQQEVKVNSKISPDFFCVDTSRENSTQLLLDSEMALRELAAIMRCDMTLMISRFEIELLVTEFQIPADNLMYYPLLAELREMQEELVFSSREHFVSIGNFRHEPNWDAVLYLKQVVWPRIRARLPKAELHVYGAYPPPKATQLHNPPQGFIVKGWADNAYTVVQQARVLLAPLRFGAGVKGKLLDAACVGTPSVTTPIGSEAMLPEHQTCEAWPGRVATSLDEFVDAAVNLYTDLHLWREAHARGINLLNAIDSLQVEKQFLTRLQCCVDDPHTVRKRNFWGRVLGQELLMSAKFKSLWIEAKNRDLS